MKNIMKIIRATLKNEVCRYQSLDVWQDRRRVANEIEKALKKYGTKSK